uniref:Uncharacterized protein LOC107262050 n=1 Tax=Rhizophora mucronata TaxID=61149 RepID=A0A2P2MZY3_RHIMU
MEEHSNKKRVRDESDELGGLELPEVKRIRDDLLLGILDDSDPDPTSQDLDSVMKSFEVEISASSSSLAHVVDPTSDSGDSQPELAHLLEASDDELGLPPSSINYSGDGEVVNQEKELVRVDSSDSVETVGFWGFEDEIPSYDSLEFGVVGSYDIGYVACDDGLFEYSNVCYDSSELSDFPYRLGTMPAE